MVKFIGEYTAKVDDKGRIVFPAAFKSLMPSDEPMMFVVKKDIFADCLEMYTWSEWERQSEETKSRLNFSTVLTLSSGGSICATAPSLNPTER